MNVSEIISNAVEDIKVAMEMEYGADFNRAVLERMARAALAKPLERIAQLERVLRPFADIGMELGRRDWPDEQLVIAFDNPREPHRLMAADFYAATEADHRQLTKPTAGRKG